MFSVLLNGKKNSVFFVKFLNHLSIKCSWCEECILNSSSLIWEEEGG